MECPCGRRHVAGAPPEAAGAPGTVTYGLNFQAWCVFLMVMHHVPVERCADILESMTGTCPSDGWVHGLPGRAARAVAAANKTIRALLILARVVCGDETPVRSGPGPKAKKKYLHVACTNLLTYYFLGDRDLPSFKAFVYSDLHGTVVVHDRYQNYDKFDGVQHQLCTAHILRDLEDAAQAYPDAIWPGQAADALRALIHQANLARDQGLDAVPADRTAKNLRLFRHGVNAGLSEVRRVPGANEKQPPGRLLLECLKHREADVLRFLSDTAIPPTNNVSERGAKAAKRHQAVSGYWHSLATLARWCRIRSYLDSAAAHGLTALDAFAGKPWLPPLPPQPDTSSPNPVNGHISGAKWIRSQPRPKTKIMEALPPLPAAELTGVTSKSSRRDGHEIRDRLYLVTLDLQPVHTRILRSELDIRRTIAGRQVEGFQRRGWLSWSANPGQ